MEFVFQQPEHCSDTQKQNNELRPDLRFHAMKLVETYLGALQRIIWLWLKGLIRLVALISLARWRRPEPNSPTPLNLGLIEFLSRPRSFLLVCRVPTTLQKEQPEQPSHRRIIRLIHHLLHTFENVKTQATRCEGSSLEQMDAHMNKLQQSKHSEHSSSLPAWLCHTKWYSSHIEDYNENITLGEGCCAQSRGWQMDGGGNMLQNPRPATTLADLSDMQVSTTGELTLPTLTQLLPADPLLASVWIFHTYMLSCHIALLAPGLTQSQRAARKQPGLQQLVPAQPAFPTVCLAAIL